jgi:hypothetical protein
LKFLPPEIAASDRASTVAPGRVRLSVAEARDLSEGALRGVGYRDDEARIIADHVIDAALCGYEYSGLAPLRFNSLGRLKLPDPNSPPRSAFPRVHDQHTALQLRQRPTRYSFPLTGFTTIVCP